MPEPVRVRLMFAIVLENALQEFCSRIIFNKYVYVSVYRVMIELFVTASHDSLLL